MAFKIIGNKNAFSENSPGASGIANKKNALNISGAEVEGKKESGTSFLDHLSDSVKGVDKMQKNSDVMTNKVASGQSEDLHETMLAVTQAELGFNLLVQVRNRALEAYQEVMRMPI